MKLGSVIDQKTKNKAFTFSFFLLPCKELQNGLFHVHFLSLVGRCLFIFSLNSFTLLKEHLIKSDRDLLHVIFAPRFPFDYNCGVLKVLCPVSAFFDCVLYLTERHPYILLDNCFKSPPWRSVGRKAKCPTISTSCFWTQLPVRCIGSFVWSIFSVVKLCVKPASCTLTACLSFCCRSNILWFKSVSSVSLGFDQLRGWLTGFDGFQDLQRPL